MPPRSLSKKKLLVLCVLTGVGGLCLSSWVRSSESVEPWGATAAALAAAAVPTLRLENSAVFERIHSRPAAAAHSLPKQSKKRDSSMIQPPDEEEIQVQQKRRGSTQSVSRLLSRSPKVKYTCDVRGNLGPCESALNEDPPGTDWIKQRWQAASDMHGSAIAGSHWVVMTFESPVTELSRIVLDWETAFSPYYRFEVQRDGSTDWTVIWSHKEPTHAARVTKSESGQSPGLKAKAPLHVVHDIDMSNLVETPFSVLRLYIEKPGPMGIGVSLWQLDVFGVM